MTEVGVAHLTRRLTDTPQDFLANPEAVAVAAVVSDVLLMAGGTPLSAAVAGDQRRRALVLVTSWLVADPLLLACGPAALLAWLESPELATLSGIVRPSQFVHDPDRREELVRLTLRALTVQPAGETPARSADRLSTVDSVRRQEVLLAAKAAEERAVAVRKAMEDERAREAAARYSQV